MDPMASQRLKNLMDGCGLGCNRVEVLIGPLIQVSDFVCPGPE
jgi:hypothetical protein